VKELFLSKLESIDTIVGLAPETLNTLAKLGEAINNDSNFYQTLITDLSFKANVADTYRKIETFSNTEVNDKMAQAQTQLTSQLALKANVLNTYNRATIDGNIKALRDETTEKLDLVYNKEQVFNTYEVNENFTLTIADYTAKIAALRDETTTKLGLVYNKEEVLNTYEANENFTQTIADYTAKIASKSDIENVYTKTQINNLVNAKEPEFITVSPIQKIQNPESGNIELMLSSDFTDLVNGKPSEEQVRTLVNAYDPYFFTSPLQKRRNAITGEYEIRMDISYDEALFAKADKTSLNGKADKTALDLLEANTTLQLDGYLTPSKIEITSSEWSQIKINSFADTADPAEISFSRVNRNQFLKSVVGVSGDTTRGAFWWAGGEDRINIDCESGSVKIKNGIEGPIVATDIMRATSAEQITVEDNMIITANLKVEDSVIITGNLTVSGTMYAENSNPFWVAGRFSGLTLNKVASAGRSDFNVERVAGYSAGVYSVSFNAHPRGANYITNATASAVQCGVMGDPGYVPTSTVVKLFARAKSGELVDAEFNFMVLA
jgi:hypothetical protein